MTRKLPHTYLFHYYPVHKKAGSLHVGRVSPSVDGSALGALMGPPGRLLSCSIYYLWLRPGSQVVMSQNKICRLQCIGRHGGSVSMGGRDARLLVVQCSVSVGLSPIPLSVRLRTTPGKTAPLGWVAPGALSPLPRPGQLQPCLHRAPYRAPSHPACLHTVSQS